MKATLITAAAAMLLGATLMSAQTPTGFPARPDPVWESCEELHDTYAARFEGAAGFGLSRMATPSMLERRGTLDAGKTRYAIESIELVGLNQRETPVVYVPLLHDLGFNSKTAESRPLLPFEKESLDAFRGVRSIASMSDDKAGTMRCVGAVRAKDTCLRCHKDKVAGDLLGAFTYGLKALPGK